MLPAFFFLVPLFFSFFFFCLCFVLCRFLVCFLVSPQFSAHNVLCLVLWFAVVPTYEDGRGSSR